MGTWNTLTSRTKNILTHRIWWHSKIVFVPPSFWFSETRLKHLSNWIHLSLRSRLLNDHFADLKNRSCYNWKGQRWFSSQKKPKCINSWRISCRTVLQDRYGESGNCLKMGFLLLVQNAEPRILSPPNEHNPVCGLRNEFEVWIFKLWNDQPNQLKRLFKKIFF